MPRASLSAKDAMQDAFLLTTAKMIHMCMRCNSRVACGESLYVYQRRQFNNWFCAPCGAHLQTEDGIAEIATLRLMGRWYGDDLDTRLEAYNRALGSLPSPLHHKFKAR